MTASDDICVAKLFISLDILFFSVLELKYKNKIFITLEHLLTPVGLLEYLDLIHWVNCTTTPLSSCCVYHSFPRKCCMLTL